MALDTAQSVVVSWPGRPHPCRHHVVYSWPDIFRRGDRPNAAARRDHLLFAAALSGQYFTHGDFSYRSGRLCVGNSRRRLNDRTNDPHARYHYDVGGGSDSRDPLCGHGMHDGDDDLRYLAGLRRATQFDHESQPAPVSRRRLFSALLRAHRRRLLSRHRLATEAQDRRRANRSRCHGCDRRERGGCALSPGVAPRRGFKQH